MSRVLNTFKASSLLNVMSSCFSTHLQCTEKFYVHQMFNFNNIIRLICSEESTLLYYKYFVIFISWKVSILSKILPKILNFAIHK